MKRFSWLQPPCVLAEFGPGSLKILDGADGLDLPLERGDNGRLTVGCSQHLVEHLRVFFRRKAWRSRPRVVCAIGAQGVSLRRLTMPRASRMDLERLVRLQIEREFPVHPEELAWGYLPVESGRNGASRADEVVVAAIKHDQLLQYEEVFRACELSAVFTVSALARPWACPPPASSAAWGVLEVGRTRSEFVTLTGAVPMAIRTLPFGGETITLAIHHALGLPPAEAEKLKIDLHDPSAPVANAAMRDTARAVMAKEIATFAATIAPGWIQGRLLLTGGSARLEGLPEALARSLGPGSTCERVPLETGEGRSTAILGVRAHQQGNGQNPLLVLRLSAPNTVASRNARNTTAWKWAALAALLAVACGFLRYVEPIFGLAGITRHITELQARQARLPAIDRDLAFLQNLRTNQPPYLELIHTLADSAPPGTRLDSISLNRRGDLSVRATLPNSDAVIGFRSKLDASSRFASVVVDEQTPSPDQQKVTVRITGQRGLARGRTPNATVPTAAPSGLSAVQPMRGSLPLSNATPRDPQATSGVSSSGILTNATISTNAINATNTTNVNTVTNAGRAALRE